MKKWISRTVKLIDIEDKINQFEELGWEFHSFQVYKDYVTLLFYRTGLTR